ncbi:RNA 3'-terminal phosphate cyclase [Aulographum hederae CBS 113979]|uniref:RNA 3'-terminal phosphate cyclase n=1 Tax=Aulographum hederae CBS 113979 TaxID=1176131 RepID=A0A6G1H774_9PEZI|nr:RNA 3'-terminal phosphate cyclase [Aulographum hederae CBS 113979]
MSSPTHLLGTTLEGGGQLLRIALGVSALTAIPIRITEIRGKRSGGGGLKLQHLTAARWLAAASSADLTGGEVKSKTLEFSPALERSPETPSSTQSVIDIGSPGSCFLVFQALLPFILFSKASSSEIAETTYITIKGGTNVSLSPSFEYIEQVLLPTLSKIGLPPVEIDLRSRGWSTGRAEVGSITFRVNPLPSGTHLPAFTLKDRGPIKRVRATVLAPKSYEWQTRRDLEKSLSQKLPGVELDFRLSPSSHDKRLYLLLVATSGNGHHLGRDLLYDRKIVSIPDAISRLVTQVVDELMVEIEHGGCVDEYMRDQLVVFQALAKGKSMVDAGEVEGKVVKPSLHTLTAHWVLEELLGVSWDENGSCEGIGLVAGEKYADRKQNEVTDLSAQWDSLQV